MGLAPDRARGWIGAALVAAVAIVCVTQLALEAPWIAGPDYFRWPYAPIGRAGFWAAFAIALGPIGWAVHRARSRAPGGWETAALGLGAATISAVAIGFRADGPVLDHAAWVLEEPQIHGYLASARELCGDGWLAEFPLESAAQPVHVRVHPPGLVAAHCGLLALVGSDAAAPVGAVLLWVFASMAPLVTYALGRALGLTRRESMLGSAALALSAAPAAFTPSFDAVWPTLIAGLLLAWRVALRPGRRRARLAAAAAAGGLGFVASMASYVLLLAGVALLAPFLAECRRDGGPRRALRAAAVASACFVGLYGLLALFGLDPFAVFAQALQNQAGNTARWFPSRAWPATIPWDLLDFGRALPWPLVVPLAMGAVEAWRRGRRDLVLLALLLPLGAALSGQVTTETFRTWMFMLPPALLLAGRELAAWPTGARELALLAAAGVSGAVLHQEVFVWG